MVILRRSFPALLAAACSPPVTVAASGTESDSGDPTTGATTSPDPSATSWGMGESTGTPTDDDPDTTTGDPTPTPDPPPEDTTTGDPTPTYCEITDCDDADPCTADTCNEATTSCEHTITPDEPCDDGNKCTSPDVCRPDGTCIGEPSCPIEHCGLIDTDEVWGPELVHLLTCPIAVEGPENPVLTILDGTTVLAAIAKPGDYVALGVGGGDLGRVEILGSEQGVLFSSAADMPAAGDWVGLQLGANADGSVIEGLTLEYAGAYGEPAIEMYQNAQVLVDSTLRDNLGDGIFAYSVALELYEATVINNGGHGIVLFDGTLEMRDSSVTNNGGDGLVFNWSATIAGIEPSFTDNIVTQNAGAPLRLSAAVVRQLAPSSSYTGNGDLIVIDDGGWDCGTWRALDEDYRTDGDIVVESFGEGPFGIEAGVTVYLDSGDLLLGDVWQRLTTIVAGTEEEPVQFLGGQVVFQSLSDPPSELSNAVIDGGWLRIENGVVQVVDSEIRNGPGAGITVRYGGGAEITGTVIENNVGFGLEIGTDGQLSGPFANNVITGNGLAVQIDMVDLQWVEPPQVIAGNDDDVIRVRGWTIARDLELQYLGVPYRFASGIRVGDMWSWDDWDDPVTLTIQPGVELEFEDEVSFELGLVAEFQDPPARPGALMALGTAEAPITFRSAATPPAAGDWQGILFQDYALPSVIDHCVIQHAGYQTEGAIVTHTDDVTITNSEISDTDGWGIYNGGGTAMQSGNTFMNNSSGDVSP